MAREKFENRILSGAINVACKFDDGSIKYWTTRKEEVVEHIKEIVNDYRQQGYVLTLRQLHYQLVTKNWIINHTTAYKKLGNILDDCRYAGIIDWDAIEDRGRIPWIPYSVDSVEEAWQDTIDQYRRDRQEGQENIVELWTEKDALAGILRRSTSKFHVKLVVNKGYTSSSAIYTAYERIVEQLCKGKRVTILYFGDHDPSGLDMVRDIQERLMFFLVKGDKLKNNDEFQELIKIWWEKSKYEIYEVIDRGYVSEKNIKKYNDGENEDDFYEEYFAGVRTIFINENKLFSIIPIGLTMEQIKKYKLPPNPAKMTDTRADKYIKKFGKICWEVDALKPEILTSIVRTNIEEQININLYHEMIDIEIKDIEKLKKLIKHKK